MLAKVISGGQSGADLAGLRAARAAGIATGGFAPRGWLIEGPDGRGCVAAPWLGVDFGLTECQLGETVAERMVARRRLNVRQSDGVLLFLKDWTPGTKGLLNDLKALPRPLALIIGDRRLVADRGVYADYFAEYAWSIGASEPHAVAQWLRVLQVGTLMVAGPRRSNAPRIEAFAESFLGAAFRAHLEEPARPHAQG
jgi:hypothetical protein